VSLQRPPDTSLLFGAVFGDPAPVSFGKRAPESSGFKIVAGTEKQKKGTEGLKFNPSVPLNPAILTRAICFGLPAAEKRHLLPFFLMLSTSRVARLSGLPMFTPPIDNRLIGMIFAQIYEHPDQFGVPGCRSRSDRRVDEAAIRAQWNQDDRQD